MNQTIDKDYKKKDSSNTIKVMEEKKEVEALLEQVVALEKEQIALTMLKEKVQIEKDAYYSRYVNAVKSFQHEKKRSITLMEENKKLKSKLHNMNSSKAWKLIREYWRFKTEFIQGNWKLKIKYLKSLKSKKQVVQSVNKFDVSLQEFLKKIKRSSSDQVVFMFSGTTYIQDFKGNRPIRITKELVKKNIPVFFSYFRWNKEDNIPSYSGDLLFQSPIDLTIEKMKQIIDYDFGNKRKIFIISFPHISCARLVNVLKSKGWLTIYDVRDEWEEFHKVGQAKWFDINVEKYIVNHADIVCAVSKPLREKMQQYTNRKLINLSPNALDSILLPTNQGFTRRKKSSEKIVGYIGHLTEAWFDWEAIIEIAKLEKEWKFEIVGHSLPKNMNLPPNIAYLGPKKPSEFIEISKKWTTAIIPFRISKLADGVDPIKVYEYLALGLPVVSFRMPQIHDYPYVYIANSTKEFRSKIKQTFTVKMDEKKVIEFLMKNRWEDRADEIIAWGKEEKKNDFSFIGG